MIRQKRGQSHSTRSREDLLAELKTDITRLNPDELETFKLLLEELQQPAIPEGERIIDVLAHAEYEREPVDIETFIKDEYYLGKTCEGIYPKWLEALIELFSGGYNEAIFCLHPDTPVPLLDGTTETIQMLADRWEANPEPFWVYGVKPDGEVVPALAEAPRCTGEDDYYEVVLDDGTAFTGNARHRMVLLTGEKRMIRDMQPGDSLMPFVTKLSSKSEGRHVVAIRKVGRGPVFCMTVPETTTFAICTQNADGTFSRSGVYSSNTGAIGTGKTFAASIGACRILYELSCLRDPCKTFGLAPGSTISIANMSVNELLARKVVFENLGAKIKSSPYFDEHFKPEYTQKEMRFPKQIWLTARATTDHSVLGMNLISAILDECFSKDSRILLEDGTETKVEDLMDRGGFRVLSFDLVSNREVVAEAYLKPSVTKECLELTFEDGHTFSASWDHPVAVRMEDGVLAFISLCDIVEHQEVVIYASEGSEVIRGSQAEDQRSRQEAQGEGQSVPRPEAHRRVEGEDGRGPEEVSGVEAHRRDQGEDECCGEGQAEAGGAEAQAVRDHEASVCRREANVEPACHVWTGQSELRTEADRRAKEAHRGCQPWTTLDRGEPGSSLAANSEQDRGGQGSGYDGACSGGHVEGRRRLGAGRPGASGTGASGARSECSPDRVRGVDGAVHDQRQEPLDGSGFPGVACRREPQGHRSEGVEEEYLGTRAAQNRRRSELLREARLGLRGVGRILSVGRVVSKRSLGLLPTYSICVPGYEVFVADGVLVHNTNFMHKTEGKKSQDGRRYGVVDQAEVLYASMKRRMKSRFEVGGKLPGMLFVVSSKQTQDDFTARRIIESMNDPSVLVRDFSLWDVKPDNYSDKKFFVLCGNESIPSRVLDAGEESRYQDELCPDNCVLIEVPEDFRADFETDLEGGIRDIAGIATVAVNPFIQRRDKIVSAMQPGREHPFSVVVYDPSRGGGFIWERLADVKMVRTASGTREPAWKPRVNPDAPRHVHIDPSLRGDATGFCVSHVSGYKQVLRRAEDGRQFAERAPVYTVDLVLQIVPPIGGEIVLADLRHLVYDLSAHGFMVTCVSLDSYQSADTIQQMKQHGYRSEVVSVDLTPDPYDNLKTSLYEDRVMLYDYPPLRKELETLQEDRRGRRRKIDHPLDGSKDVADALAGCLYTLSQRSLNQPLPFVTQSAYAQDPWMPEQHQAALAAQLEARMNETLPPLMFGTGRDDSWVVGGGHKR